MPEDTDQRAQRWRDARAALILTLEHLDGTEPEFHDITRALLDMSETLGFEATTEELEE